MSDYALKFDIPALNWFLNKVILGSDSAQVFMQCMVVIAESIVGLALIGGLFTFLAAGASLALKFMFLATTGLYLSTVWMLFAGVAMLIGGGSVFGLDYYVLPVLKEKWTKNRFAGKWYLYND